MPKQLVVADPGTPEWYSMRMGKFTGSQMHRLMSEPRTKADREAGKLSSGAMTYILECVAEMLTGERQVDFKGNVATEWGNKNEPVAIHLYELLTGNRMEPSPYLAADANFGATPDSVGVTEDGRNFPLEVKSPDVAVHHMKYFMMEGLEPHPDLEGVFTLADAKAFKKASAPYFYQTQTEILALDAPYFDFVSFNPTMPDVAQVFVMRVPRCEETCQAIEDKVKRATAVRDALYEAFVYGEWHKLQAYK